MNTQQASADAAIKAACAAGDFHHATSEALRLFGAELYGFLIALNKDHVVADDAFSLFSERFWQTLPTFEWKCSLRTWLYRLARNAAVDVQRGAARQNRHNVPISQAGEVSALIASIRSETLSAFRTERQNAFQQLRELLSEEDRLVLMLRVDRQLSWLEIARILSQDESSSDASLEQDSARLRKRFQLVKERLRKWGKERGLV